MAYIGKEPAVGNFQVCDAISVVNGQAAYTMQVSSTNVVPESANHMLVSLNGILQKPNSSFTVSGSTITFASNLATGDVIDFIMLLGNVLDIGTPSDSTVTDAKANFVSTSSAAGLQIKGDGTTDGTLQLNCSQNSHGIKLKSPAHSASASYTLTFPTTDGNADEFLKTDGSGVLSWATAGGGKIAQVVSSSTTSTVTITAQSYTDSGITASITPSATSSKVLILISAGVLMHGNGRASSIGGVNILRDSTSIYGGGSNNSMGIYTENNTGVKMWAGHSHTFLDSPSTTSATTYKMQGRIETSGESMQFQTGGMNSVITLIEVLA